MFDVIWFEMCDEPSSTDVDVDVDDEDDDGAAIPLAGTDDSVEDDEPVTPGTRVDALAAAVIAPAAAPPTTGVDMDALTLAEPLAATPGIVPTATTCTGV